MGKRTVLMIDPPQGWHHGFPKAAPDGWNTMAWEDKKKWYIKNNYPEKKIESYGEHFYCSQWEAEIEDNYLEGKANLLI
jgi:hypothetical protein